MIAGAPVPGGPGRARGHRGLGRGHGDGGGGRGGVFGRPRLGHGRHGAPGRGGALLRAHQVKVTERQPGRVETESPVADLIDRRSGRARFDERWI